MSFELVNFDDFVKLTVHFRSVFGLGHVFGVFALNDVLNQKGRVLDLIEDFVLNAGQWHAKFVIIDQFKNVLHKSRALAHVKTWSSDDLV